jgi:hypothetical protein
MAAGLCQSANLVQTGYAQGVPMGGDLPTPPPGAGAPSFVVQALMDPQGTKLQQIQIVKGWVQNGQPMEQVFLVAGGPNGATVDTTTCTQTGPGSAILCEDWVDPSFDPSQRAFYYARVLENPSCRWSAYDCINVPAADRPAGCSTGALATAIQERAWTSPIWYRP